MKEKPYKNPKYVPKLLTASRYIDVSFPCLKSFMHFGSGSVAVGPWVSLAEVSTDMNLVGSHGHTGQHFQTHNYKLSRNAVSCGYIGLLSAHQS